ncbi:unnamed protein product [Polarella glacialis]|uniref:Uncharacterized protein n=1 Tax=Polarella glacialis TaxID=89957 RepID=A0A813M140_POLGL|nr:unnamed protein product [Polarella glacialis]
MLRLVSLFCSLTMLSWVSWASGQVTASAATFSCASELFLGDVVSASQKGLALDDMTAANCSNQLLQNWPHTGFHYDPATKVKSIRIFKPWAHEWPEEHRAEAWKSLVTYIRNNNVKVLLGTSIGCIEDMDRQTWEWAKELLQMMGPEHLLGLAIGNELEMFHIFTKELNVDAKCLKKLWDGDYAWNWFKQVVSEFDAMGYARTPVTSIFGGLALGGNTSFFYDTPEARVNTFLSKAVSEYKMRYVFTFNFYPYFDPHLDMDDHTEDQCTASLAYSLCWEPNCNLPETTAVARKKMTNLTGNPDWPMWLGEVGWSSRYTASLLSDMKKCKDFSSAEVFQTFYQGFLGWNLSISNLTEPLTPPEQVFWFTMRDSSVFGIPEYFGLVSKCHDSHCKMTQDKPYMVSSPQSGSTGQGKKSTAGSAGHRFATSGR